MYKIWNFGRTRKLPYRDMNIEMHSETGFQTDDRELAEALKAFPYISVKEVASYDKMRMGTLRKLALEKGVTLEHSDTKDDIIKKIEVKQNG